MPRWLATVLLVAGLLIGAAFLAELVLVAFRRHRHRQQQRPHASRPVLFTGWWSRVRHRPPATRGVPFAGWVSRVRHRPAATRRVLFAGWVSLVGHRPPATRREPFTGWGPPVKHPPSATRREPFTGWGPDVGRPPPAARRKPFTGWGPRIILADYDRLVVTHSRADDTVYVLRPPGEDPRAILRVARLVLKEDPYQQLAAKLGVPASWPME
jgi:hypothetical protein